MVSRIWTGCLVITGLVLMSAALAFGGIWESHGPNGGVVFSLSTSKSSPGIAFAGTNGGGFFKSTDGGSTWSPAGADIFQMSSLIISSLAVDPTTASRVYATANNGTTGFVFHSTDGGATWTSPVIGAFASQIAVDPVTPTTLYASGAPNVVKSVNAGETWNPVLAGNTFAVAVDPLAPSTVYVGAQNSLLKSTDGGASWTGLGGGLGFGAYVAIVIHPVTAGTLYAGSDRTGVYKSTDGGTSWTSLGPDVGGSNNLDVTGLAIDPVNPQTIYVSGLANDDEPGVFKSIDGGATWEETTHLGSAFALAINPTTPATLLAGTTYVGLSRTTDSGATWPTSNEGLVNTSIGALAVDTSNPGSVYAGSNGRDVMYYSTDGGQTWDGSAPIGAGFVASLAVDPTAPGTVYAADGGTFGVSKTTDGGATWSPLDSNPSPINAWSLLLDPTDPAIVYAGGFLVGVLRSVNGGDSWTVMNNGLIPAVISMAIDPSDASTLYAGTSPGNATGPFLGIFKTTNAGGSWTPVNDGITAPVGATVMALAIDPNATGTVYAAIEAAGVYKTTNGGDDWAPMNEGLGSLRVSDLVLDAAVPDTLYLATRDDGVFVSNDGAATWSELDTGLYNDDVRSLAAEPGRIYAGTSGSGTFVMDVATSAPSNLLGRSLSIKSPSTPSRRKITVTAREMAAEEELDIATIAARGATLFISASGEVTSSQTFDLPPPWTASGTTTVKYADKNGVHGPVQSVVLKRTPAGLFTMSVKIVGNTGSAPQPHIHVVAPNPGTHARVVLTVNGGEAYCVGFGGAAGGKIKNSRTSFSVSKPTAEACP